MLPASRMSPYVVPEHGAERCPLSSPTGSAASTVISFGSLDSAQTNLILEDDVLEKPPDSEEGSVNTSVPPLSTLAYRPHTQHKRFFFDDGNITFLVGGILYRVHRYYFCRDSSEFRERLSRLPTQKEPFSPPIISLGDVKSADFDAFLSVLYPLNFNPLQERSFKEWTSILDLSTRWGFISIRDLAIHCVKPPSAYHRLLLARKHAVDQWVLPALSELCERPQPLSVDEARLMDFEDIVLVGSVRESVRSHALSVNPEEIDDCIEAWKKGEPWSPGLRPRGLPSLGILPRGILPRGILPRGLPPQDIPGVPLPARDTPSPGVPAPAPARDTPPSGSPLPAPAWDTPPSGAPQPAPAWDTPSQSVPPPDIFPTAAPRSRGCKKRGPGFVSTASYGE